jgi:hypothetical protein
MKHIESSSSGRIVPVWNDRTQVLMEVLLIELRLGLSEKQRKDPEGGPEKYK